MSLAKKCDICGKLYEPYTTECDFRGVNGIVLVFIDEEGEYGTPPDTATDCCPECMKAIMYFIDGLRNGGVSESKVNVATKEPEPEKSKVNVATKEPESERSCETCLYGCLDPEDHPCCVCNSFEKWLSA